MPSRCCQLSPPLSPQLGGNLQAVRERSRPLSQSPMSLFRAQKCCSGRRFRMEADDEENDGTDKGDDDDERDIKDFVIIGKDG